MKSVIIKRENYSAHQVTGHLYIFDETGLQHQFNCFTLELPDLGNQRRISCIPPGTYKCTLNKGQGHINYPHYDVLNVKGRDGIKIHVGNYHTDILGCILVGSSLIDMNGDGDKDVTSSGVTLKKLIDILGNSFTLTIK